jgi:hypothetical protein
MVVGEKRRWRFRAEILGGVDQTRDYTESLMDPRNMAEVRRIFATTVLEPKRTVIGGTIAPDERDKMDRAQRYISDVDIRPYNDVLAATRRRFEK